MRRKGARDLALGAVFALSTLSIAASGCGDEPQKPDAKKPPAFSGGQQAPAPGQAPAGAGADGGAPSPTAKLPPLPLREFQERDFAESDQNRDPFRSFAADLIVQNKARVNIQRKVLVDRYALEELKLVGLVNGNPSRALLTDPTGLGWIAKVGDYVGKPELVHSGGPTGADVPINWRVDRIRQGDVVFVREDPSHPEIPATTRVVPLRTVEENSKASTVILTPTNP